MTYTDSRYHVTYEGGFLFIADSVECMEYVVRLENTRGQCITRGQFRDSVRTHGLARACETFMRLAAESYPLSSKRVEQWA